MTLETRFVRELGRLDLPTTPSSLGEIGVRELEPLPEPAQRYLSFMGVVGRPKNWSFIASFVGRFRLGADQPWRACEAWQYSSGLVIARHFHMRLRVWGMPVHGRDTYADGHGRMVIRPFDLVTVVDGHGAGFDRGEQVTWLNDAVLLAPSFLFHPGIRWGEVDAGAFDLSLTDAGRTVRARVTVDRRGAPVNFETEDRSMDVRGSSEPVPTPWSSPVRDFQCIDGRQVPRHAQAVWQLESGPFPYADFELVPDSLRFDVEAGH